MIRFVLVRLMRAVITILAVVTFAFVVLRMSGDPAQVMLGPDVPQDAVDAFRKTWGLDQPIWIQYLAYIKSIFTGDFGVSMRDKASALHLVLERVPATLQLTLPALILKLMIGIPAGVYAALHRQSFADRGVITLAIIGFTVPSFVMGLVLVLIFSVLLGVLPSGGQDTWMHGILPTITMSIGGIGILARFSRSAMIEVLGQPYIRTASAKGLKWRDVIWSHALPNAAVPIVTIVGFMVGSLIAGAVVVESIFSWPGIGRLLIVSVSNRDLAVVQCILLIIAAAMVMSNLVVDLLYGWLDPRLRSHAGH
ncbi:ABC transporter permease [Sinorhizobium meliloti WSM1022]|jgi:peptide/nickel transport system permease protein|uniref:Arginine ABC transporter, permease component n=4 Tax=Rhizobium meliloti TaxID=382 RepID=Q92LR4_RHIME|nr:ABC transporter permease [Sinorhizobium meliloti]PST22949.1 ABC transporter permease [Mesorhizobium loti]TWA96540.1 peptide/nickel transport system permease protein [Ensifer sp. SEMIA 134]TWB31512.1 peptide/nickel transport system permease protein [Ensifer sp. SEMIA 135]AEG05692.1 ABC-type transporter, integral membrane subunit [Sinorhizobium meliloti BL225C]AEG54728.1 ABC-type transporter, integral membrane subunit [Sinorhizobium meliloti AK83]